MVTSEALKRTFHLKFGDQAGTCFAIDVEDKQYLITAAHIVTQNKEQNPRPLIMHDKQWKDVLYPQWSGQKRPMVVGSKPANGCRPERGSFILVSPGPASPFSFSSSAARISVCDRGVAVGPAWR
jgi:hypothetical protein